jgi:phage terminase small subunit
VQGKSLTPKQRRFVAEYLVDLNATQAAIRCGYSKKTASAQGSRLLSKAKVAERVAAGQAKITEKAGLSAALVRETLERALRFDPANTVDANGDALPVHKIPDRERLALAGHERKPVFYEGKVCGEQLTVKYPEKTQAAMAAAKLLGLLVDKLEVSDRPYSEIIQTALERAKGAK